MDIDKYKQSLNTYNLKPTHFALSILELLVEQGVQGMSLKQLEKQTEMPRASIHRYLKTLTESGWVEANGSKQAMLWKPSTHFIKLAFNYRNAVRAEVDRIGAEFKELTGEDL
ncbi:helix-turn-helix domain-containing protein [Vibrio parahaemolyticus]